ncbi:MAG: PTS glucose transporter subunit IIA [Erysipelotrichaceae bacterium]|nr:PTS glucose transporter subunit IIA [Erysipelotrichaceae bacterium]
MFKNLFKPKPVDFIAPFSGKLLPIEEVPDPIFAQKTVGDGFAIEMTSGEVFSPVDGTIVAVFPTGHAIGIRANDRNQYLLHFGIDTVKFNGQGFTTLVSEGQQVSKGDPISVVDLGFFRENNVCMVCPIIVTNANQRKIILLKQGNVEAKEEGFLSIKV